MKIDCLSSTFSKDELKGAQSLIKAFFPDCEIEFSHVEDPMSALEYHHKFGQRQVNNENNNVKNIKQAALLSLELNEEGKEPLSAFWSFENHLEIGISAEEIKTIAGFPKVGKETLRKLLVKQGVLRLLSKVCGKVLPWGTLTGIRPAKLIHQLEDLNLQPEYQSEVLAERYGISLPKIRLLQAIEAVQRPYLRTMKLNPQLISVYVGIPFCPSRCSYCSFPGYQLKNETELEQYLNSLGSEILSAGEMMDRLGLKANAVYIGGGTPTILSAAQLERLIHEIKNSIPLDSLQHEIEFTVEAGRPDTLSQEKLYALKEAGVNRISINPQTMHDKTLKRIGRNHSAESILEIFETSRKMAAWIINMDLILGLPGEGKEEIIETLQRLKPLKPDNITVHALALKKGSREKESGYTHADALVIEQMQEITQSAMMAWGLRPYYLYRQKQIAGNLENTGYARSGKECLYNIAIMEERQSILGIGAGSSTKIVNPSDLSLVNLQHSYNWNAYMTNWRIIHSKRLREFSMIFTGKGYVSY